MFSIKRLLVTGDGKQDSEILFEPGLNIIYGPSNTGKSYVIGCIDYVFGAENPPFPSTLGYDTIQIQLAVKTGEVSITRKLGEKCVEVQSNDRRIESGKYKLAGKNNLNSVLLTLLGIEEVPQIISTKSLKHSTLSWRNILRLSLIPEKKIIEERPIYFPSQSTAVPAEIMTLVYLDSGNDFSELIPDIDLNTLKIKKSAIKDFLQSEVIHITDLIKDAENNPDYLEPSKIESEIDHISSELLSIDAQIHSSVQANKDLSLQIMEMNAELNKLRLMKGRYYELKSQYIADLERLNFIADTGSHQRVEHVKTCPFCKSKVQLENDMGYVKSALAEHHKIQLQLKDLEKVISSLLKDEKALEKELEQKATEFSDTEKIVKTKLEPYSAQLKANLNNYRTILQNQANLKWLTDQAKRITEKIKEVSNEEESSEQFETREHLSREFIDWIEKYWENTLQECAFENYSSSYFDKKMMDIVVNGQEKRYYGKGYRAFLNSIVAMGIVLYLKQNGKYSLPLLLIDSPILSLKEDVDDIERASSPMCSGLFKEFVKKQSDLQIIIIENDIPKIDYESANLILFTKSRDSGRYGFLLDVYN